MYENRNPFARHPAAGAPAARREEGRGGDALRAVAWSELTARLNAARDLRQLLRHEAGHAITMETASFSDAAASYFSLLADGARDVNPVGLGGHKACGSISGRPGPTGHETSGPGAPAAPDDKADGMRPTAMQEKCDD